MTRDRRHPQSLRQGPATTAAEAWTPGPGLLQRVHPPQIGGHPPSDADAQGRRLYPLPLPPRIVLTGRTMVTRWTMVFVMRSVRIISF